MLPFHYKDGKKQENIKHTEQLKDGGDLEKKNSTTYFLVFNYFEREKAGKGQKEGRERYQKQAPPCQPKT